MSGLEIYPTQEFVDGLDGLIRGRIQVAQPVERLSHSPDILLQLVEEEDGRQFVTRSFTRRAVNEVEACGRNFEEVWDCMQETFRMAGISPVRTEIAINDYDSVAQNPVVMVSEYLAHSHPIIEASTQTKVDLAARLPRLFRGYGGLKIHSPVLQRDMFRFVTTETGEEAVVLMDVDPRMVETHWLNEDGLIAYYIERFGDLLWQEWCTPEERTEVLTQFIKSAGTVVEDKLDDPNNVVFRAFFNVHTLSQGIDYREHGLYT